MTAIHQVLGVFAERDAVGGHTLALREALRARGVTSDIYADETLPDVTVEIRSTEELPAARDLPATMLVYQASSHASVADDLFARREPLIVNYHNVTPAGSFWRWEPSVARSLAEARRQLRRLASRTVLGVADSRYNADELREMGYPRQVVVPVLIDTGRLGEGGPSPWPTGSGARWLFVGRLTPNKAQHDIVKAFALYRRVFDRDAVLALPGRSSSHRYQAALDGFIEALGISDAVLRPGSVPDDELGRYYREADVFVCLSDHEGFCNTVVEAMAFDLPVVTYRSSALPETVGDAAVVLPAKSPAGVAEAVHRVLDDATLRSALVEAGRRRHRSLALASASDRLCDVLLALTAS